MPPAPPQPGSRVSLLAIFGVILAAIACCPFANLIGSVLGMMALQRIALSNGALRGRRLARTAMVLGLCFAAAGSIAWWRIGSATETWLEETATAQTQSFVAAAQQGSTVAARAAWASASSARLPDDAVLEFGRAARERFGPIKSFSVTSAVTSNNLLSATYEAAGSFRFESGDRLGSVLFVLEPSRPFTMPAMRLRRITISDADHGDLTLPAPTPPSTNPTSRSATSAPDASATAPAKGG